MAKTATQLEAPVEFKLKTTEAPPVPTHDEAAQLVAPFAKSEEYVALSDVRAQLSATKGQLDGVPIEIYMKTRDRLFPLAHSGVSDRRARFSNRAGHKLNQCMETMGMWDSVLARAPQVEATSEDAPDVPPAEKRARSESGTAGEEPAMRRLKKALFVDICGGPGAFSQALFQTAPSGVKVEGLGLTLMDKHVGAEQGWYPALLEDKRFAVSFGVDGTGNIYSSANVECFVSLAVGRGGAQIAVADGGFEVPAAQANVQEALSSRIVFAQWYVALKVLCRGGGFVLKLFDTFTAFSKSLLFLSCAAFEDVRILKPLHSRAVNSERYLACRGFVGLSEQWMAHLEWLHASAFSDTAAPLSLLPFTTLDTDVSFTEQYEGSVRTIAETQVEALQMVLNDEAVRTALNPAEPREESPAAAEPPIVVKEADTSLEAAVGEEPSGVRLLSPARLVDAAASAFKSAAAAVLSPFRKAERPTTPPPLSVEEAGCDAPESTTDAATEVIPPAAATPAAEPAAQD